MFDAHPDRWDELTERLYQEGMGGNVNAIAQIRDTMDGKPAQTIIGDNEQDPVNILQRIERVIVDNTGNTDSEGVPPVAGAGEV